MLSPKAIMSMHTMSTTRVDQDTLSKLPVLHPGDITLAIMWDFEECCITYFEHKDITKENQVRRVLAGLKDLRVKGWLSAKQECLVGLEFNEFMEEFHAAYLNEDWEEMTRQELGGMVQGNGSFWDFAVCM
jgi:hypothetical protein